MATNLQMLGDTLAQRMKSTAGAAVTTAVELGTINGNMSLTCDSLRTPIPRGDYMIAGHLIGKAATTGTTTTTIEIDGKEYTETHSHTIPASEGLIAGARVLVAWCGNDAVVIDTVTTS